MLRNYFVVAIRTLTRNKFFSSLNIFGLAISMTLCMAIMMIVADQMEYDRYNTRYNKIYRILSYHVDNNGNDKGGRDNATSPMPLAPELSENFTGIKQAVRLKRGFGNGWLELENQNVNIPIRGFFADAGTLEFFEYELEFGDSKNALIKPYSVVLTRAASDKLFKDYNPVGQTLQVGDIGLYTVTGVLKETSKKSHIVFEALASMSTVASLTADGKLGKDMDNWMDFWNGWTYVELANETAPADLQRQLDNIHDKHIAGAASPEEFKAKFRLQALSDITPGPIVNNAIGPSLPWVFVYFLAGLASVVMISSCFNFTNLSIARSLKRAKEIGVRKVTGAMRWQIFTQFLSEAIIISFCALLISLVLLVLLKPLVLQLTLAKIFKWDFATNYVVVGAFVVFTLVVGFLAGLFPALVLSGFEPIKVLKNLSGVKLFSRLALRKTLLVIQFTFSLIFILSVIVMYKQLKLFIDKDYGFTMDRNIAVKLNNASAEALKNELLKYSNITSVSAASHLPSAGISNARGFKKDFSEKDWTHLNYFCVDEDYLENMEIELVAGKFFSKEYQESNENFLVINEEAIKALHFSKPHDAIGEELISQYDSVKRTIIGVVKNYNHNELMSEIEPMTLMFDPKQLSLVQARYTGTFQEASSTVEKAWSQVNPSLKIDYKEIAAEIRQYYNTVFGDLVSVLGVVAALAIIISCLGLLGMTVYTVETRMREVSIRKVLGSSDKAVVVLLSKGFIGLLGLAILIGLPAGWFLNNMWLQFLAHRISIDLTVMAPAILALLVLGIVTIGSQTLKAAFANPIKNLKSE
jgi:putative ABC transport system permease protein